MTYLRICLFPFLQVVLQLLHFFRILITLFRIREIDRDRLFLRRTILLRLPILLCLFCLLPFQTSLFFFRLQFGYLTSEQYTCGLIRDVLFRDVPAYILGVVVFRLRTTTYQYLLDEIKSGCGEWRHTGKQPYDIRLSVSKSPFHKTKARRTYIFRLIKAFASA